MFGWEHRAFKISCFYSRDVLDSIEKPIVIIKMDIENYECKVQSVYIIVNERYSFSNWGKTPYRQKKIYSL